MKEFEMNIYSPNRQCGETVQLDRKEMELIKKFRCLNRKCEDKLFDLLDVLYDCTLEYPEELKIVRLK